MTTSEKIVLDPAAAEKANAETTKKLSAALKVRNPETAPSTNIRWEYPADVTSPKDRAKFRKANRESVRAQLALGPAPLTVSQEAKDQALTKLQGDLLNRQADLEMARNKLRQAQKAKRGTKTAREEVARYEGEVELLSLTIASYQPVQEEAPASSPLPTTREEFVARVQNILGATPKTRYVRREVREID